MGLIAPTTLAFFLASLSVHHVESKFSVDVTGATAEALLATLLGSNPITTWNATVSGHNCKGFFSNGGDVFSTFPSSGILLSTGCPPDVLGPDNSESKTTTFLTPGDEDLTRIFGVATEDACSLSFAFDCPMETGCPLYVKYVLGSEEYTEFVTDGFIDPVGMFLNDENIALLPGITPPTQVALDAVNEQVNSAFFITNPNDPPEDAIDLQADGLTTTLTASAMASPGLNQFKFVIADALDPSLDSVLFLEAGSFGFEDKDEHAASSGDPHFRRWKHTKRDSFQGECDLVLFHSDSFMNGMGLNIHIRTTITDWNAKFYSFIEQVAIGVGNHVLEIHQDDVHYNGKTVPQEAHPFYFGDGFNTTIQEDKYRNGKIHHIVQFGETKLVVKRSKDFMSVEIIGGSKTLGGSVGMLGTFEDGRMLARDGHRILKDFDQFGFEWQVNPEFDPILFMEARPPQLPTAKCIMPTPKSNAKEKKRELLRKPQDKEFVKKAKKVCHKYQPEDFKLCLKDILATGDLDLAMAW